MSAKTWMIHQLGTNELLLPSMVNGALAANDKAKYFFTLLQVAKDQSTNPEIEISDLKNERLACGIEDPIFDSVVKNSKKEIHGIRIPHVKKILENITKSIQQMILPLDVANSVGISISTSKQFNDRLERIQSSIPAIEEYISEKIIDDITTVQRNKSDSLHLLVMDLHKELNKIQSQIAQESIDGARVYGVTEGDKDLIKSFMTGINHTIKLKFEHPGLGTIVTRSGDTLVIQNDIGTTDAHILVIHIKANTVSLTYTDIHLQRLQFFHSLFEKFNILWNDTTSKKSTNLVDSDVYHLSIGTYNATDQEDLKSYLKFLGSRIVFLIDWNRARKQLRNFVKKKDAVMLLKWAADNQYGHRGFLEIGGGQMIYDIIEQISKGSLRYGESLYQAIGQENAIDLLKFILKTTTEGLLEGRSMLLIKDEIRTELMNYLRTARQGFLDIAINHASLVLEISSSVRDGLLESRGFRADDILEKNAKRAQKWEKKGDELVKKAREMAKKENYPKTIEEIIVLSDDVADSFEETAFMLTLMPKKGISENCYQSLNDQADIALQCSREYLKLVENARHIHRGSPREDMEDFLHAIDTIITLEHQADETNRAIRVEIMKETADFRELYLLLQISQNLEDSIDMITRLAFRVREYILENLMSV